MTRYRKKLRRKQAGVKMQGFFVLAELFAAAGAAELGVGGGGVALRVLVVHELPFYQQSQTAGQQ